MSPTTLHLDWCTDPTQEDAIVDLLLAQAGPHYISHSELQGPRADAPGQWRRDFPQTLRAQVRGVLAQPPLAADWRFAVARTGEQLAAVALVSIDADQQASHRYATLEDIAVRVGGQGGGIGRQLVDWLCTRLQREGIARLFLESGNHNASAHRFFHARGFQPVSVVMFKELNTAATQPGA